MKLPQQRKEESIFKLKSQSVPYIAWLPFIESADEIKLRSAEDIAKRAIACLLVIQAACDLNNDQFDDETRTFIIDLLQKFNVFNELTAKEQAIISCDAAPQDIVNMVWKYEAYWALLWALGIVKELK